MNAAVRTAWFRVVIAACEFPSDARADLADHLDALGDDYTHGLAAALRDRTHRRLPIARRAVN